MKLILFNKGRPGLLKDDGVIDITTVLAPPVVGGQAAMKLIIEQFENLKAELTGLEKSGDLIPFSDVILDPPLPNPGSIMCMGGNFSEFGHRAPSPMWGFLKSTDAIIGPDDTVILPSVDANIFHHEAELVVVFGRTGQNVDKENAFDYVFGYSCGVDVSARMPANTATPTPRFEPWRGLSPHKSFPTFAPIGPSIVTKDEIQDPHDLRVHLFVNDELRGDFNTSDMSHSIAESIAFVSSFQTFHAGDLLYTGTNHQGLGAMQNGDIIRIQIDRLGGFSFTVRDELMRIWEKGIDEETAKDMREGTGGPGRQKRPL